MAKPVIGGGEQVGPGSPGPLDTLETSNPLFPVVGIGASAGGLAAFEAFFRAMPADGDSVMGFVLVQHLAPDHKSVLTQLISRYTRMQVFEVEDGMVVQPNCAYIIPPNREMALEKGVLKLTKPSSPRGRRLPIDFFFLSLARELRHQAICIVLSGTGSDGTAGLRAIKSAGGLVMAQHPDSCEYDGMPKSAIATGLVDYSLPPNEMPAQLVAYWSTGRVVAAQPLSAALAATTPASDDMMKRILARLHSHTGHDFSQYKPSTISRVIQRRMVAHQLETIEKYGEFVEQSPLEIDALFAAVLIGVTRFFRDREAFAALGSQVLTSLFGDKPAGGSIRIWCPGCSTGEEAYSLAIVLQEHLEATTQNYKVQVFATDIDSRAIATARAGRYPASIAADVSPARLARFFALEPDRSMYRVQKHVRDMLVFSEQDMVRDPPFSRIDLISCRNLLIYMGQDLQKKAISLFYYALNPGGFLFLGSSESVGDFANLFSTIDSKQKLYQRHSDFRRPWSGATERLPPNTTHATFLRSTGDMTPQLLPHLPRLPLRELGAMDYVTKPFNHAELLARVRASLQNRRVIRTLESQARIDPLTGLGNRATFVQRFASEICLRARSETPLSIILMELDHLETITGTHGQSFCNQVLAITGTILHKLCRLEDIACHFGEGEFGIIAPNTAGPDAFTFAERIRSTLACNVMSPKGLPVSVIANPSMHVTGSFGVADALNPFDRSMIERADDAAHHSRQRGGNCVSMALSTSGQQSIAA